MSLLTLFSLLFLVVAIAGSGAVLFVRGLRLWRNVKSLTRAANEAMKSVTAAVAQTEAHAAAVPGQADRLTHAADRLQASLGGLAVLRAAAGEVKHSFDALRGAVPRK